MNDNHTELCERLRVLRRNWSKELGESAVKSADLIEQQAARIAELEKERDALKADAERYVWAISLEDNAESLCAAVMSCGPSARDSINIEIDAAIQAEKGPR